MQTILKAQADDLPPPTPLAWETELQKDTWHVGQLPGVRFPAHRNNCQLDFTQVPAVFRDLAKSYLRFLLGRYSFETGRDRLSGVRRFLQFMAACYPQATDLTALTRHDVENYYLHLRAASVRGSGVSQNFVRQSIMYLKGFLLYLERCASPAAPSLAVSRLLWLGDIPKRPPLIPEQIRYIPEFVLAQLEAHMHHLSADCLPVVIILRASGWRISDVLHLRHDACLERSASGWWLCGDIAKTQILRHRVPLSEEIAALVTAQCARVRLQYTETQNPQRYLFPAIRKVRAGRPMGSHTVCSALRRLVVKYNICDETGRLAQFSCHSFRHTKAVELINNGMSLVHVQKWMAHVSVEMTLVYAKILDPTLRQEWEKAFAQGAVRITAEGTPQSVVAAQLNTGDQIAWEHLRHNLDAVRLPNGYCFKPRKAECPTQAIPCHTCHHFCTTPDFLPQFRQQQQDTQQQIALGEQAGNAHWVERNRQNLARLEPIIVLLEQGHLHHPAGKEIREGPVQEGQTRRDHEHEAVSRA